MIVGQDAVFGCLCRFSDEVEPDVVTAAEFGGSMPTIAWLKPSDESVSGALNAGQSIVQVPLRFRSHTEPISATGKHTLASPATKMGQISR